MNKPIYTLKNKRIWVAGHNGMVGSAILRRLKQFSADDKLQILTVSKDDLDLRDSSAVEKWIREFRPEVVFLAAAKVGGIYANNQYPADFLYDNLMIAANIIHCAFKINIEKLLFLGSSCIYPRAAEQPIVESALMTGALELTNQWYAIAKIAGIKLCQSYRKQYGSDFISAMPSNLFGPGDNFHPENAHVPAALLSRFHDAKLNQAADVTVWGSGIPKREFLYVDDLADAAVYLMEYYSDYGHINVGTGVDISIKDFADKVKTCVGYQGELVFDNTKPDGTPRKVLDVSKLNRLGWGPKWGLDKALENYYDWFCNNFSTIRT